MESVVSKQRSLMKEMWGDRESAIFRVNSLESFTVIFPQHQVKLEQQKSCIKHFFKVKNIFRLEINIMFEIFHNKMLITISNRQIGANLHASLTADHIHESRNI